MTESPPLIILKNPNPTTLSTQVHAEEDNNIQVDDVVLDAFKFINPFATLVTETKYHPLEQVRGNPSKPVQTRRQLATDLEMRFFALTVSETKPNNIKEAMTDYSWIEAMQEEHHQFDRVGVWEIVKVVVEKQESPIRVENINGKKYILVIVDDYSRNPDPTTPSTQVHAEEDNNIQADDVVFDAFEFINPFAKLVTELGESSSHKINLRFKLEDSFLEMHFFALTVSETKPKNIKEAMTNHAWIEAMQEEHHQFDRVDVWELVEVVVENKKDKESTFIHNKAHLVAKGYRQE
ncbi:hypothetical protein Tco_0964286 [Tanacetum coccineum]